MATVGSIINSLIESKCTKNIEKMKVKLPTNDKFCEFGSITEQESRNLVKEFGKEVSDIPVRLKGSDPHYYELRLQTVDPHSQATIRVEQDGSLTKLISNLNHQYSIDMYSKQGGRIKNMSNNGTTFEIRSNADGDILQLSEKQPDKSVFTLSND